MPKPVRKRLSPKGDAKREEILQAALETLGKNGYRDTSVRDLADAVGLSQTGLLHHFESKDELFAEIIRVRDDLHYASSDEPLDRIASLSSRMRANQDDPGLIYLFASVSTEAGHPDHPSHEFFVARYERLRAELAATIREMQTAGNLAPTLDPEAIATIIVAIADGLQTQWLLDRTMQMGDYIDYFMSVIGLAPRGEPSTSG